MQISSNVIITQVETYDDIRSRQLCIDICYRVNGERELQCIQRRVAYGLMENTEYMVAVLSDTISEIIRLSNNTSESANNILQSLRRNGQYRQQSSGPVSVINHSGENIQFYGTDMGVVSGRTPSLAPNISNGPRLGAATNITVSPQDRMVGTVDIEIPLTSSDQPIEV